MVSGGRMLNCREPSMAYFINDKCVGCTACETVCPVTAITGVKKEFYFIDPKICIDCGACGRACPYDAIFDTYGDTAPRCVAPSGRGQLSRKKSAVAVATGSTSARSSA